MTKENPNSRWFVVLDSQGRCVGKHDTNAVVNVPVEDYSIIKLDNQPELDNYSYDDEHGYQ